MSGVWTNNWQGVKNLMILGYAYPGLSTVKDKSGNTVTLDDATKSYLATSPFSAHRKHASSNTYAPATEVLLGSGDTAPAATDCDLETPITSGLTCSLVTNNSVTWDTEHGKATRHIFVTVQAGAAAKTIKEWGLYSILGSKTATASTSNNSSGDILVYRALLDTPVELDAYESAVLDLELSITLDDPV